MKKYGAITLITICTLYLFNPGAGVFELLPDNIPFLGNVDETLAAFLIFSSIQYLRTGTFKLQRK
jgi:hypothetical protein